MTLLFIWTELPDSSFLGNSVLKKKKKGIEYMNILTSEGI